MPNKYYTYQDCGHKTTQPQYSCSICYPGRVDQEIKNENKMKVSKYIDKKIWVIIPSIGVDLHEKAFCIVWLCMVLYIRLKKK